MENAAFPRDTFSADLAVIRFNNQTANNKKVRERQFLEEFSINYPEFPAGKIVESESPDFLIEQSTKLLASRL